MEINCSKTKSVQNFDSKSTKSRIISSRSRYTKSLAKGKFKVPRSKILRKDGVIIVRNKIIIRKIGSSISLMDKKNKQEDKKERV